MEVKHLAGFACLLGLACLAGLVALAGLAFLDERRAAWDGLRGRKNELGEGRMVGGLLQRGGEMQEWGKGAG